MLLCDGSRRLRYHVVCEKKKQYLQATPTTYCRHRSPRRARMSLPRLFMMIVPLVGFVSPAADSSHWTNVIKTSPPQVSDCRSTYTTQNNKYVACFAQQPWLNVSASIVFCGIRILSHIVSYSY
ncbi:hypothetical protein CRV24_001094 [Beauveria bassiana]|nr:hypothetical protein CRV24_001094 [Beauveria bassiana]